MQNPVIMKKVGGIVIKKKNSFQVSTFSVWRNLWHTAASTRAHTAAHTANCMQKHKNAEAGRKKVRMLAAGASNTCTRVQDSSTTAFRLKKRRRPECWQSSKRRSEPLANKLKTRNCSGLSQVRSAGNVWLVDASSSGLSVHSKMQDRER